MSIVKYGTGLRFHRCDDTGQEDEMEMSRPGTNVIVECPICGEGMQTLSWDEAVEEKEE